MENPIKMDDLEIPLFSETSLGGELDPFRKNAQVPRGRTPSGKLR